MLSGHPWARGLANAAAGARAAVEERRAAAARAEEARKEGRVKDPDTQEWVFYYLDADLDRVEAELARRAQVEAELAGTAAPATTGGAATTAEGDATATDRPVADRTYYDLLGVSPGADAADIKRAYYRAARQCHPDKNPDDPGAHERFQKLGHAYQVLSNPAARDHYDKHGIPADGSADAAAAAADLHEIDPLVFFNVMFGSSALEPYVGELWIAQASESLLNDRATQKVMQDLEQVTDELERHRLLQARLKVVEETNALKQTRRVVKCARNLRERTQPYLDAQQREAWVLDHVHKWELDVAAEADRVAAGAYGALYCKAIGKTLATCAEQYLAFETDGDLGQRLAGLASRAQQAKSTFGANWQLLGATVKAASAGHKAMRQAETLQQHMAAQEAVGAPVDEAAAASAIAETMDQTLPAILEFTWAINKRDIQNTLKEVFGKLLADNTLPKADRKLRAEAVLIFGRQFYEAGKRAERAQGGTAADFSAEDIKARVAAATMTTMAKAQGQEVSATDAEEMIRQAKQMQAGVTPGATGSNDG